MCDLNVSHAYLLFSMQASNAEDVHVNVLSAWPSHEEEQEMTNNDTSRTYRPIHNIHMLHNMYRME